MSGSDETTLKQEVKQTEMAVSAVAEVGINIPHPLPPLPAPPPVIHGPPQQVKCKISDECLDEEETSTDELQDAWLASLNAKTQGLDAKTQGLDAKTQGMDGRLALLEAQGSAAIKHAEAEGKLTDNALRKNMADKTFLFMERWCMFVGLITFIYVAKHEGDPPKEFMLALLGTCTISIIGLVGFVVSGLFKSTSKDSS